MRKRIIHVLNWEKYQARSDKELPWCKLWGALFKRPWFQQLQDDEKFCTILFLDLARQFNNRIPDLSEFKGYLRGNYGLFMEEERVFNLCKLLSHKEFLSDNVSDIQDKTRLDEMRKNPTASPEPLKGENPKSVCLKDIIVKDLGEPAKHKLYNELVVTFDRRGWRTDVVFLKQVFSDVSRRMESYSPKKMFPYFKKAMTKFINENAEYLSKNPKHREINPDVLLMASSIGREV